MFSYSFINADFFTLGIDPGDAFFIFDVHNYASVLTFMQYFSILLLTLQY